MTLYLFSAENKWFISSLVQQVPALLGKTLEVSQQGVVSCLSEEVGEN